MANNNRALLSYNEQGALSNCLAIEDHLASLPPGVNNSWCAKKHAMLCCGHHLAEAINHASRISPELGDKYRRLRNEAVRALRPGMREPLPKLGDVAAFRNHMRQVFSDPTLIESCELCSKDGLAGLPSRPYGPVPFLAAGVAGVAMGLGAGGGRRNGWVLLLGLASLWKANDLRLTGGQA